MTNTFLKCIQIQYQTQYQRKYYSTTGRELKWKKEKAWETQPLKLLLSRHWHHIIARLACPISFLFDIQASPSIDPSKKCDKQGGSGRLINIPFQITVALDNTA
jgi:hypothetical protein